MEEKSVNTVGVSALAYLGDSVYELTVREHLIKSGISSSAKLNKAALDYVTATAQSEAVKRILDKLTPDELQIYKRGKNHKTSHCPKSAAHDEYQRATGLEVLFAALYLQGNQSRISELFTLAFSDNNQ
ncbi:MAG: ribonuclease III [Ruminococcaceae bacterium]|nr:ribonuclease III [Oscillospiraceae bacterium]